MRAHHFQAHELLRTSTSKTFYLRTTYQAERPSRKLRTLSVAIKNSSLYLTLNRHGIPVRLPLRNGQPVRCLRAPALPSTLTLNSTHHDEAGIDTPTGSGDGKGRRTALFQYPVLQLVALIPPRRYRYTGTSMDPNYSRVLSLIKHGRVARKKD